MLSFPNATILLTAKTPAKTAVSFDAAAVMPFITADVLEAVLLNAETLRPIAGNGSAFLNRID